MLRTVSAFEVRVADTADAVRRAAAAYADVDGRPQMVPCADLRTVQPDRFADVAGMIRRLAEVIAGRADDLLAAVNLLTSGWSGVAATAALNRLTTIRTDLYGAYLGLIAIDQALTEFAIALAEAQDAALAAARRGPIRSCRSAPMARSRSSRGTPPTTPNYARWQRGSTTPYAQRTLPMRNSGVGSPRSHWTSTGTGPCHRRSRGTDPDRVAAWWNRLAAAQQRYLTAMQPDAVSGLDGIPADVRDQASRIALDVRMAMLTQQDQDPRQGRRTAGSAAEITAIDAQLSGLTTLDGRLTDPHSVRAYLLDIDTGDDRAIVSISDPDRAAHTLTFVPGIDSGPATVSSTLNAIDNIRDAGTRLPPTDTWSPSSAGDLATIGWLDSARAGAGAGDLSAFSTGLRADSIRTDPHESVLGYSYGSVVVGLAATRHGLSADNIILVGSPGTTADDAADFGLDPGHVWATTAKYDAIRFAATPSGLLSRVDGRPRESWFGRNPIDPAFGAHVFTSDPGSPARPTAAHVAYFDPDTTSLQNIARIAVGDTADVT